MARVRIKICGITTPDDALCAAEAGADAIGLVFYPASPRAVSLQQAAEIQAVLPPFVTTVGLFVNPAADAVRDALAAVPLDCLQFRGTCVLYGLSSGPIETFNPTLLSIKGCLYLTRPSTHQYHPTAERFQESAREVFDVVKSGAVKVHIGQRTKLTDVAEAHRALEERRTIGATVLIP